MRANRSLVKETISAIIQWPLTARAMATATALGTNDNVTSCSCVIDCTSETARPTTRAVMSTGAESFAAAARAWVAMSRTADGFMARSPRSSARAR